MSKTSEGASRGVQVLVAVVVVGCYAAFALATVMSLRRIGTLGAKIVFDEVLFRSAFFGFPAVGGLLATRKPRNPVGWLLLGLAVLTATSALPDDLIREHLLSGDDIGTSLAVAATVTNALTPVALLIFLAFLLYFPDAVPHGWQRVMLRIATILTAIMVVVRLFRPGSLDLGTDMELENPLGISAFAPIRDLTDPLSTLVGVALLVAVGVVVGRFVRADGIRRLQYKWLIAALGAAIALQFVTQFLPEDDTAITIEDFASVVAIDIGLLGLCVAIGIAITRHRLFELDRIVSRTLAWTIVTAVVVAIYSGAVVALGGLFRALGGEANDLVVAASTLLAAVSVRPLLGRTRLAIDRRFDRAHYDGVRAVGRLSSRLRDEIDVASVADELTTTTKNTLQPASAWVWLPGEELA